ncbi:MAG: MetQ/NlpA family ABC transporter substrate-binding protein, partial [Actinomycetia bacterium]|nr:MetQ/NlpA family ABC transporter substrate-binding protein [Actinomycetes bacterium]
DSEAANQYANVLVVKEGNENDAGIQKLISALKSDKIRSFIIDKYDGSVVPVF